MPVHISLHVKRSNKTHNIQRLRNTPSLEKSYLLYKYIFIQTRNSETAAQNSELEQEIYMGFDWSLRR